MIETTQVYDPRCEYLHNPLGIDVRQPRLSWKLRADRRGARQTAYQLRVWRDTTASPGTSTIAAPVLPSQREAGSEGEDLWDTGKLQSEQSVHVVYDGPPPGSGERAWWSVRIWDEQDRVSEWSEPAWWEMGLLERGDWTGAWMGAKLAGGPRTTSPCPLLRTTFVVDRPVASARLYVSALGLYECLLNGHRVGDEIFAPGWTDYHRRVQYQVYDVADLLVDGQNALGAILGDGWYCGHVAWNGRQNYGDRPRLLAQLTIRYADGSVQVVASDRSWRTSFGPILESDLLMGESYDARRELPGWTGADFDDGDWQPAEDFADPGIALVARRNPPVRAIAEMRPIAPPVRSNRGWIFDLGQNMVGRVRLRVRGAAGTTITLRHAEVLDDKGELYTVNLRTARQTDHYTLRGEGEEVYEPRFTFHGFRYVELIGMREAPSEGAVTGIVLHSDTPVVGSWECSDPLLNQLQHNITWGQRGNFLEVPTDCPQRDERLGWTGDAQVFIRTAAFNMDVARFFAKWQQDMEDAQNEAGAFPPFAPDPGGERSDGGPAWADAGIICPWTIYLCYGDTRLLAEHYGSMQRFVDYLQRTSVDLIRCHPDYRGWLGFGDWLSINAETPRDLIGTAFFAHSARLLAQIASVLGKTEDAQRYELLADAVREAFRSRFVTAAGLVASGSQTAYVLALHFDLLPAELRPAAVEALVRDVETRGTHLSTGFVGSPYLPHVLSDAGRLDVAYDLLRQQSWPSWLYSVTQGATTIWERWDGWTHDKGFQDPGMNSFNHYAYGAIGAWLYQVVAGIDVDPVQPGYRHVVLRPRPGGDIDYVRAEYQSPYGQVVSQWRIEDGAFDWQVTLPPNTTATVCIPAAEEATVTADGLSLETASGITSLRSDAHGLICEVVAGTYHFRVAPAASVGRQSVPVSG